MEHLHANLPMVARLNPRTLMRRLFDLLFLKIYVVDGVRWWWFEMRLLHGWIASRIVVARLRMRNLIKRCIGLRFLSEQPADMVGFGGVL